MKFIKGFFEFLLEILVGSTEPGASKRPVVYRNYSAGPFDFAEVA